MNKFRTQLDRFLGSCGRAELLAALSSDWLNIILPGIGRLVGCEQGRENHSEGDVAVHTSLVFECLLHVCQDDLGREADFVERLAALIHDWKKPITLTRDDNGAIRFPGHEHLAATEVPALALTLGLSPDEEQKLFFLVAEHGNAHRFPQLAIAKQQQLQSSPYVECLCALQKADAMSCICADGGHLPVFWHQISP